MTSAAEELPAQHPKVSDFHRISVYVKNEPGVLARVAMVEAAWLWLRHQPDSALSQWFHDRTQGQKGRIRRVMIVALARKLAIALWRYLETGLIPEGAVVK